MSRIRSVGYYARRKNREAKRRLKLDIERRRNLCQLISTQPFRGLIGRLERLHFYVLIAGKAFT
jgi:hypothetical protein